MRHLISMLCATASLHLSLSITDEAIQARVWCHRRFVAQKPIACYVENKAIYHSGVHFANLRTLFIGTREPLKMQPMNYVIGV